MAARDNDEVVNVATPLTFKLTGPSTTAPLSMLKVRVPIGVTELGGCSPWP